MQTPNSAGETPSLVELETSPISALKMKKRSVYFVMPDVHQDSKGLGSTVIRPASRAGPIKDCSAGCVNMEEEQVTLGRLQMD
jgi:hypothetical protein